ncbi:MAG: ribonuclease III [Oscillospiraceae bacterium]|jgi:ribonuclease-3 family protein|nr:ribonuclease III [Oscillospiraceae bacterium]
MQTPLSPKMGAAEINALSVLALAQVGDAVFELMVRTRLCQSGTATARAMHLKRVRVVSAGAQSAAADKLRGSLTDEEAAVYARGRNTRVGHIPRAATRKQYQAATALEALWGWLWLTGRAERLETLFELLYN